MECGWGFWTFPFCFILQSVQIKFSEHYRNPVLVVQKFNPFIQVEVGMVPRGEILLMHQNAASLYAPVWLGAMVVQCFGNSFGNCFVFIFSMNRDFERFQIPDQICRSLYPRCCCHIDQRTQLSTGIMVPPINHHSNVKQ